ncbi:hypothetical protein [Christiangramia crocea]|uniref:Uncharacterized protein n=1 Tax=Christiangramia crocea TaxID=2904124 RepID=A0A9X1UV95_9FLAO|nr:hypothetical protein [Gramella crocea]MCG9971022.1 hypothetical protein [Gramella crocea]
MNEITFARKSIEQDKIRDLLETEEGKIQVGQGLAFLFTRIPNLLGIKEAISYINKSDIKELILMRFKTLSLEQIDYAFKMERYGYFGDQIQHFQLFNSEYVGKVLDRFIKWLQKIRMDNNIPLKEEKKKTITENQKQYWINRGVLSALEQYKENKAIEDGYIYIYDVLYEEYLPKEKEYKDKIYESAKVSIQMEYSDKEATSKEEKQEFKNIISSLEKKGNTKVKLKCKELVLCEFFRKLLKDEKRLTEFKEKYKYD